MLIIAFTQVLLRYTLIIPFLEINGKFSSVNHTWFFFLVLSTCMIAAGGYLINDADDAYIDLVNKSKTTEKELQSAMHFYGSVLLLGGVITGFCISFFGNMKTVWGIQLFAAILLFNYSAYIKKIPMLASIAVALLTVLSILVIYTSDTSATQIDEIKKLVLGYSLFAFLLSLARETVKDMQDAKGDKEAGRRTLPLIVGNRFPKLLTAILLLLIVILLVWIQIIQQQWTNVIAFAYVIALIQTPLLFVAIKIFRDETPSQYAVSSQICRLVMLTGVLTMPLFYFIL